MHVLVSSYTGLDTDLHRGFCRPPRAPAGRQQQAGAFCLPHLARAIGVTVVVPIAGSSNASLCGKCGEV